MSKRILSRSQWIRSNMLPVKKKESVLVIKHVRGKRTWTVVDGKPTVKENA